MGVLCKLLILRDETSCKLLKGWSHPPELNRRPADYEFHLRAYAIDSVLGLSQHPLAYSAWRALIEPDSEPNCDPRSARVWPSAFLVACIMAK